MKTTIFIYNPPAQDTVVKPLAEAICLARGGQTVLYSCNGQEGFVTFNDQLAFRVGMLKRADNGEEVNPQQVALMAQKQPVRIRVDVNDVHVMVSSETTIEQAMAQLRRKIDRYFEKVVNVASKKAKLTSRQRS